jgi:hypothetical protein
MRKDTIPADRERLLPALTSALLADKPKATSLHFRYEGTYREVSLEEAMPCAGVHGPGSNQVKLRYNADFTQRIASRSQGGSSCGAVPFYWASSSPKWLRFTSTRTLLAPDANGSIDVAPELLAALESMLANPDADCSNPPEVPAPTP